MTVLPSAWTTTKFDEVADIQLGKMLDKTKNRGIPTPYLRNVNVRWGSVETSDIQTMPMSEVERSKFRIEDGDLLVCEGGEPGRAAVWKSGPTHLKFQKALLRVRTHPTVVPDWLMHYLWTAARDGSLAARFSGTTIKHLPREALQGTALPLAPTKEQRRIVAKIDSLSAKSKRARNHLDHVSRLVEQYRFAILQAGYNGALTECWRAVNKTTVPELSTLGEVVLDIRYGTAQKCGPEANGVAVLRIPNISSGSIDLSNLKYTDLAPREYEKLRLHGGDILVIRSNGSVNLVGRSALISGDAVGMAYAGYLIRVRPDQTVINPKYLVRMLDAPQTRKVIEVGARSTSGVHNINSGELAALVIPLPSLAEQDAVVHRIETAFTWIDRLAAEATSARKLIDHLDQAVLSKAFRGELVPQDPNDEPASVLLERIKIERAGTSSSSRRRGRPRTVSA